VPPAGSMSRRVTVALGVSRRTLEILSSEDGAKGWKGLVSVGHLAAGRMVLLIGKQHGQLLSFVKRFSVVLY